MKINAGSEKETLDLFHLAKIFLHGEDFEISLSKSDEKVIVKVSDCDKAFEGTSVININKHIDHNRAYSCAVGEAFYNAVSNFEIKKAPYGLLTGVRPVKVPLFYLNHGKSTEETEEILISDYKVAKEKAKLLIEVAIYEREYKYSENDFMLYVSVPFCPTRCNYCSFVSQTTEKEGKLISTYLDTLISEMKVQSALVNENKLKLRAVYIGGGTPGILSAEELDRLIKEIKNSFDFSFLEEFTVELGRPDTVSEDKLCILINHGIKRICINPQTTSDKVLCEIGRKHTRADYFDAIKLAKSKNFFSINSDLIAGLSGDTPEGFLTSVKEVLELGIDSVTVHALCHKNAASLKDLPENISFEKEVAAAHRMIKENSLLPYYLYRQKSAVDNLENVGFSKKGTECKYNVAMMEDLVNVISLGAGGATKIVKKTEKGYDITRIYAYKYPLEYIKNTDKIYENSEKIMLAIKEKN